MDHLSQNPLNIEQFSLGVKSFNETLSNPENLSDDIIGKVESFINEYRTFIAGSQNRKIEKELNKLLTCLNKFSENKQIRVVAANIDSLKRTIFLPVETITEFLSYLPPNRLYSRAENAYNASMVCPLWKAILQLEIDKVGKRALQNIHTSKIVGHGGPLRSRDFNIINALADKEFVSPKLVTRLINQEAPVLFTLKILGMAETVTIRDFNEAVTAKVAPEILLCLFDKLADKRQDCVVSVVERGHLDGLETLMSSPHYDFPDKLVLDNALSSNKDNILNFILEKNPQLKEDPFYSEKLFEKALKSHDYTNVAILLAKNPHLNVSYVTVLSHPQVYDLLLNRYLDQGNKFSFSDFKKWCIFTPQKEKETELKRICEIYIRSNHIANMEDAASINDKENLKALLVRIPSLSSIMQETMEKSQN